MRVLINKRIPNRKPKEVDRIASFKVTDRINEKAFELLEKHPEGLRLSKLASTILALDPDVHPKTVNGCI